MCADIIKTPQHIIGLEDGLIFSNPLISSKMIKNNFSITFWIYLAEEPSGSPRVLLCYGDDESCFPLVVLHPFDLRIDVYVGSYTDNLLEECGFTSQVSIKREQWTYVAITFDSNQINLYIDGKADSHKVRPHGLELSYPNAQFYVGRLPLFFDDNPIDIKCGFEGYISLLQYYNRALQPIHINVNCERTLPRLYIPDDLLSTTLSSLYISCNSLYIINILKDKKWIYLLLKSCGIGTIKVQISSIKLLSLLLPKIVPSSLNDINTRELILNITSTNITTFDNQFIKSLFYIIGYLACNNLICNSTKNNIGIGDKPPNLSYIITSSTTLLSSLLLLMKSLLDSDNWKDSILTCIDKYISTYPNVITSLNTFLLENSIDSEYNNTEELYLFVASLYILNNNNINKIYSGSEVQIAHTDMKGRIVTTSSNKQVQIIMSPVKNNVDGIQYNIDINNTVSNNPFDGISIPTGYKVKQFLPSQYFLLRLIPVSYEELYITSQSLPSSVQPKQSIGDRIKYFMDFILRSDTFNELLETASMKTTINYDSYDIMYMMIVYVTIKTINQFINQDNWFEWFLNSNLLNQFIKLGSVIFHRSSDFYTISDLEDKVEFFYKRLSHIRSNPNIHNSSKRDRKTKQEANPFFDRVFNIYNPVNLSTEFLSLYEDSINSSDLEHCLDDDLLLNDWIPSNPRNISQVLPPQNSIIYKLLIEKEDEMKSWDTIESTVNMYYPLDSSNGAYGYNAYSMFTLPNSEQKKSSIDSISSELLNLNSQQITDKLVFSLVHLCVLYSRSIVINTFDRYLFNIKHDICKSKISITNLCINDFERFIKMTVCRGIQLGPTPYIPCDPKYSFGGYYTEWVYNNYQYGMNSTFIECPSTKIMGEIIEIFMNENDEFMNVLVNLITNIIDSCNTTFYRYVKWGIRQLNMNDRQAYFTSNLELACWLFFKISKNNISKLLSNNLLQVLFQATKNSNFYLRNTSFQMLSCLLREYRYNNEIPDYLLEIIKNYPISLIYQNYKYQLNSEKTSEIIYYSDYIINFTEFLTSLISILNRISTYKSYDLPIIKTNVDSVTECGATVSFPLSLSKNITGYTIRIERENCNEIIIPHIETSTYEINNLEPNSDAEISVRCESLLKCGEWSKPVSIHTSDGIPLHFSSSKNVENKNLVITNEGLTVCYNTGNKWTTVIARACIWSGKMSFSVKIDEGISSNLFVGVASPLADQNSYLGSDNYGWGYMADQELYHSNKTIDYGEKYSIGDIITVIVDLDRGIVSFGKNGKDFGVAFEQVTGPICPAVSFYNNGQKITIIKNSIQLPIDREFYTIPPKDINLTELEEFERILESIIGETDFPEEFLNKSYNYYIKWRKNEIMRYTTQYENLIEIDSSKETLEKYGFLPNQIIITPSGKAKLLGLADKKLWFMREKDYELCFYHPSTLKTSLLYNIPDDDTETEVNENKILSKEEFKFACNNKLWNKNVDKKLCTLIKQISKDNMLNISSIDVLHKIVSPLEQYFSVSELGYTIYDIVSSRTVILLLLSNYIQNLRKHINLSISYCNSYINNNEKNNINPPLSHLNYLFSQLRYLPLFNKTDYIKYALNKTSTQTKMDEDEYEYPDEMQTLNLCQYKAYLSRSKLDPDVRVSNSIFGQSFEQLHFLDINILRISFLHPLDDYQRRTFKVHYDGEGVDDYGGPYRECFSQYCDELQATKTVQNQSDKGIKEECILPLFIPTPNRQNHSGLYQDCFMINPSTTRVGNGAAHLYLELYNFLGQIIAIAIRSNIVLELNLIPPFWKILVGESLSYDDIEYYDTYTYNQLKDIEFHYNNYLKGNDESKEYLQYIIDDLTWSTFTSDGYLIDIKPNGSHIPLTIDDNLLYYVNQIREIRLNEFSRGLQAIRDGLLSIIPAGTLGYLTWEEMQYLVCNEVDISIKELKSITEYDDNLSLTHPLMIMFWKVLESFNNNQRKQFIRFVSARTHIPKGNMSQKFKIQKSTSNDTNPDKLLPIAHTCFFSLNLPEYSSFDIMREKLLYAISNCIEMDADYRLTDNEIGGWGEDFDEGNRISRRISQV